jgi:hypothetical protein
MRATLLERLRQFQDYLFEKYGEMPSGVEETNQIREERDSQIAARADTNATDTLHGKYPDADFPADLEEEHRREMQGEATACL